MLPIVMECYRVLRDVTEHLEALRKRYGCLGVAEHSEYYGSLRYVTEHYVPLTECYGKYQF